MPQTVATKVLTDREGFKLVENDRVSFCFRGMVFIVRGTVGEVVVIVCFLWVCIWTNLWFNGKRGMIIPSVIHGSVVACQEINHSAATSSYLVHIKINLVTLYISMIEFICMCHTHDRSHNERTTCK